MSPEHKLRGDATPAHANRGGMYRTLLPYLRPRTGPDCSNVSDDRAGRGLDAGVVHLAPVARIADQRPHARSRPRRRGMARQPQRGPTATSATKRLDVQGLRALAVL